MNHSESSRRRFALVLTAWLAPAALLAQTTTNTWIRAVSTGGDWNDISNWSAGAIPDANTIAEFNLTASGSPSRVTFINFNSAPEGHGIGVRHLGAVTLAETDIWGRIIRGTDNSTNGAGVLVLHGVQTQLGSETVNLLVANYTSDQLLAFRNGTGTGSHTRIGLASTGVVYAAAGSEIEFASTIEDADGSHGIIKRGEGLLSFTSSSAAFFPTYSGGFTLEEGIVQWASSGTAAANPFGTGPLTLRGGTLRSSTTSGRTLSVPVVLDGNVTFGSTTGTTTGFITVNSESGTFSTILASDSRLTNHNQVSWNQGIHGTGNLTKAGDGLFHFTSASNSTFEGTLTVEAGVLRLSGTLANSPLVVESGARVEGYGSALAGLSVAAGATFHPGLDTERGTFSTGFLSLAEGANLSVSLDSGEIGGYDSITATGPVNIDGALLSVSLNFNPDPGAVFVLIDNQSGTPISGLFNFGDLSLAPGQQFTVSSGDFSASFFLDYSYAADGFSNSLAMVAVPEPGSLTALAVLLGLGIAAHRRRRS